MLSLGNCKIDDAVAEFPGWRSCLFLRSPKTPDEGQFRIYIKLPGEGAFGHLGSGHPTTTMTQQSGPDVVHRICYGLAATWGPSC